VSKVFTSLGLMSGTSLDGIDVALLRTDGEGRVEPGPARTFAYDKEQQALLRQALVDAAGLATRGDRPGSLRPVEERLTQWHVDAVHAFCAEMNVTISNIDIIGFHGQTVLHRPEARLTVQLGDGQALADATGLTVAYDMRAEDVAAGGQGAPLVPVYHRALAARIADRPLAIVNIGGVANMTWIGTDDALVAFDTGPGNALINDWCERLGFGAMDRGGTLAAGGVADEGVIAGLMENAYFKVRPPKSLDRNSFDVSELTKLRSADGARTLTGFTATALAQSLSLLPGVPTTLIICGGGRLNPVMMDEIRQRTSDVRIKSAEDIGINGDSLEAEAWAYLAVRALRGLPITFPGTTGVAADISGGVIVRPSGAPS
jgi:anhydro-N-acetylmuramic acid kinase